MRVEELAKAERALAKAQAKLAEFDAIRAILDPYQRANPKLTVEGVIPLLLRDGRPGGRQAAAGIQCSEGDIVKPKRRGGRLRTN
jgi:hypothetical protein